MTASPAQSVDTERETLALQLGRDAARPRSGRRDSAVPLRGASLRTVGLLRCSRLPVLGHAIWAARVWRWAIALPGLRS